MANIIQVIERNKNTGALRFSWHSINADGLGTTPLANNTVPQWALEYCCGCSLSEEVASADLAWNITGTTAAFNVAQGAREVVIKNVGASNVAGNPATATVDGKQLQVGQEVRLKAEYDPVTKTYKTIPAIAGNGNGSMIWILEAR